MFGFIATYFKRNIFKPNKLLISSLLSRANAPQREQNTIYSCHFWIRSPSSIIFFSRKRNGNKLSLSVTLRPFVYSIRFYVNYSVKIIALATFRNFCLSSTIYFQETVLWRCELIGKLAKCTAHHFIAEAAWFYSQAIFGCMANSIASVSFPSAEVPTKQTIDKQ